MYKIISNRLHNYTRLLVCIVLLFGIQSFSPIGGGEITTSYEQNATGLPRPEGLAMTTSPNITDDSSIIGNTPSSLRATAKQSQSQEETFIIYFRRDKINIDENYLDNKEQLQHINEFINNSPQVDSIVIYAYASPEGVYEHNVWLAKRRSEAAQTYLLSNNYTLDNIILRPMAENWDGLYEEVYNHYHRHDRDKVLKILSNKNISNDTKKWRLQQLDNGTTYRYLIIHNMPRLRSATWIYIYHSKEQEIGIEALEPIQTKLIAEEKPLQKSIKKPTKEKVTIAALKTNMLYDLAMVLNAELEVPIGKNFSIMLEDVFPWWTWGPNNKKYALQMWEIGIEPRWWFARTDKRDKLSGQFLGLYAMSSAYDFQNNFKWCYQGEYWSVGLSYGFSFPIGKYFNLELSASVGYLNSDYRHYQPDPAYEHLYEDIYKVGTFSYFGPTKLKVSLVLPITIWRTAK